MISKSFRLNFYPFGDFIVKKEKNIAAVPMHLRTASSDSRMPMSRFSVAEEVLSEQHMVTI